MTGKLWSLTIGGVLALAFAFGQNPAVAQAPGGQQADSDDYAIEEIVVTSRRREESLQDLPLAVTALTAESMQEQGVYNVEDVGEFVPNLTLTTSDRSNNTRIIIRGIGGGFPDPTQSFGTGLYINGVYIPNSIGGYMSTLDIERVEVLRGPQGTLFGKNTTGGAVVIVTAKPHGEFEAKALARAGSFGRSDGRVMVNAPLSDTFFVRMSAAFERTSGYYKNTFLNTKESGKETKAVTGSFRWVPNQNWTVDQIVSYSRQDDDNRGGQCQTDVVDPVFGLLQGAGANGPFVGEGGPPGSPGRSASFRAQCAAQQASGSSYQFSGDKNVFSDVEQIGLFNTVEWDSNGAVGSLDNLSLKTSTSWRLTRNQYLTERDYTNVRSDAVGTFGPAGPGKDNWAQRFETFNIEVLMNGEAMDGRLNFVLGYNFFQNRGQVGNALCHDLWKGATEAQRDAGVTCTGAKGLLFEISPLKEFFGFPIQAGPPTFATNIIAQDSSHGAFAHAGFDIFEWLTFDTGIRYTRDRRKFRNIEWLVMNFRDPLDPRTLPGANVCGIRSCTASPLPPSPSTLTGVFDPILSNANVELFGQAAAVFDNWTPMFAMTAKLPESGGALDSGIVYVSASKGFLTGGFNTEIGSDPNLDPLRAFGPETVWTYEIGSKTQWAHRRLQINIALFYSDYNNKQEQINIDNSAGIFPGDDTIGIVDNVAQVKIKGLEVETRAVLWEGGLATFDLSLLSNKFKKFLSFNPAFNPTMAPGPGNPLEVDRSNVRIQDLTAKWTIATTIQHTFDLGNAGQVTPRFGVYAQAGVDFEGDTLVTDPNTLCFQKSYAKYNARLTYHSPDGLWQAAVFGNNIFNTRIVEFCDVHPGRGAVFTQLEAPASWGIEITARWGGK